MTPPTLTPAEQIARFIERHPGQWWPSSHPNLIQIGGSEIGKRLLLRWTILWVYPCRNGIEFAVTFGGGPAQVVPQDLLLSRLAEAEARHLVERGGDVEALPPWLHDPVRRELRRRAGELLTLAGSSPADVVSAAETLDEYLVSRGVVEVTGILPTLMEIGMSCRWAKGYDESPDDYIALVSRRLAAVAGECETLRVTMKQAIAHLDAYDRSDGHEALAPINARAVLRRVLEMT